MGNCQPRPQHRTVATIEQEQFLGQPVTQATRDAAPDVFTRPRGTEPIAFEAQEGDLVERVDRPQAGIEFKAIDDPDRIA
jgi:hypothetical protein